MTISEKKRNPERYQWTSKCRTTHFGKMDVRQQVIQDKFGADRSFVLRKY